MASHRSQIGNERFRNALARVIAETVEFPRGVFVTLSDAKIAVNQKQAFGLLSVYPFDRQQDALRALARTRHAIQDALAHALALRSIPKLEWKLDDREEAAEQIEMAIGQLREQGELS